MCVHTCAAAVCTEAAQENAGLEICLSCNTLRMVSPDSQRLRS